MRASFRLVRPAGVLCALALSLTLPSCKSPSSGPAAGGGSHTAASPAAAKFEAALKPSGHVSVRIITNNAATFWMAMEKGMNDEVANLADCDAKRLTPVGAKPDNNAQKTAFENALAGKADGIAVSAIKPDVFAAEINSAIDSGVPVITFDSDAPTSKRLVYLGTNNYEAGKQAGEAAVKLLPNGGKFIAFVGDMSSDNALQRYKGFMDAVKGHNITALQDPLQDGADKTGQAYRNVADAITKYPGQIDLMLGIYSYNGPAIVDEVQKAGVRNKVKIVCFDGEPKTLESLAKGAVDATVVQKPYDFGRLSTRLLYLINRKGLKQAITDLQPELDKLGMKVNGSVIDTGVEVVTPANAAPFLDKLKKLGLSTT